MKKEKDESRATASGESRGELLARLWGNRKATRLNRVTDMNYFGKMTVREFAAIVLADAESFPKGLDTQMCIGDVEGNFCTDALAIMTGGPKSDHVCVAGDPHGTVS